MNSHDIKHLSKFRQGEQGTVGLCKLNDTLCVYKLPKFMNFLTTHEYYILQDLATLSFLPHFLRCIDYKMLPINLQYVEEDPFQFEDRAILLPTLFIEYVPKSIPFLSMIEESSVPFSHCLSIIKQTMCAILFAQKTCSFTHYDLHALNILLKPVDDYDVHVYRFSKERTYIVPTYGLSPVIIDYGFSYSKGLENNYLCMSPEFTNVGIYAPTSYDMFADAKRFLISIMADIKDTRTEEESVSFRNVIKNVFLTQDVCWESGWNTERHASILSDIILYVEPHNISISPLFKEFPHHCFDLLTGLVQFPLQHSNEPKLLLLRQSFQSFFNEFIKIEKVINQSFFMMYFLRTLVCLLQRDRNEFVESLEDIERHSQIVHRFQRDFETCVRPLLSFCQFDVNYETLMCSAYLFSDYLGAEIQRRMTKLIQCQQHEYTKLPVRSTEEIYGILDYNFPLDFHWTVDHTIVLFDYDTKRKYQYALTEEQCGQINSYPPYMRSYYLQQMIENAEEIKDDED